MKVLLLTLCNPLEKQRVKRNIDVLLSMQYKLMIVCPYDIELEGVETHKTQGEFGHFSENRVVRLFQLFTKMITMFTVSTVGWVSGEYFRRRYSESVLKMNPVLFNYLLNDNIDLILIEEIELLPLGNYFKKKHDAKSVIDMRDFYWDVDLPFKDKKLSIKSIYLYLLYLIRHSINKLFYVRELKFTDSMLTVSHGHYELIRENLKLQSNVIYSAVHYYELKPNYLLTEDTIDIVYHGGAFRDRSLDQLMQAVSKSVNDLVLHLYLTDPENGYLGELKRLGCDKVVFHDPVNYTQLVNEMNQYDMGIIYYPPYNSSLQHTLPNKFFEYIQSRLGIIAGPSPDLKYLIQKYDLGPVALSFELKDLVSEFDRLTPERVNRWKTNSDTTSEILNFDIEAKKLVEVFTVSKS